MSLEYDEYLREHITNVGLAYDWIRINLPEVAKYSKLGFGINLLNHDASKYSFDEYYDYDSHFYEPESDETKIRFEYAWLHHIHNNPHHWEYWVIPNDGPLDIPYKYVIEMICDWWSFSFKSGDLYEIFDWYESHKNRIMLSANTRNLVEDILLQIKNKLDERKVEV